MKCQYCGEKAEWVSNEEIYGKKYGKSYMIWLCRKDNAYVGCHNNSKKSLGSLANAELRNKRKEVKNLFIKVFMGGNWNNSTGKKTGYSFLKKIFKKDFHFGDSTLEELEIINNSINKIL